MDRIKIGEHSIVVNFGMKKNTEENTLEKKSVNVQCGISIKGKYSES